MYLYTTSFNSLKHLHQLYTVSLLSISTGYCPTTSRHITSELWPPFPWFSRHRVLRSGLPFPTLGGRFGALYLHSVCWGAASEETDKSNRRINMPLKLWSFLGHLRLMAVSRLNWPHSLIWWIKRMVSRKHCVLPDLLARQMDCKWNNYKEESVVSSPFSFSSPRPLLNASVTALQPSSS